jgi:hypothetical protein
MAGACPSAARAAPAMRTAAIAVQTCLGCMAMRRVRRGTIVQERTFN